MLTINDKVLCPCCFEPVHHAAQFCGACGYGDGPMPENTGELPLGTTLQGKYIVGKVLGRGGFGVTYLAYDTPAGRKSAIKEYFPYCLSYRAPGLARISCYTGRRRVSYETGAENFLSEAKTLSRFSGNANIINISGFFYENNTAYYVMEYVDGVDLKKYIALRGGKLPYEEMARVMAPVLSALIIVHGMGVLHRDVSPDNIYVTRGGGVKLLDFGAARQMAGENSNGMPVVLKQGFAPVEQYQKHGGHGPWGDVYSLGATMYYALTGAYPEEAINRVGRDTLVMPSRMGVWAPPDFEAVLWKMMAVRPKNRYQSVMEVKKALQKLGGGA